MKELTIKNLNTIEAIQRKQNDNEFYIKPVVAGSDANQCTVSFIEVPLETKHSVTTIMKKMRRYFI